LSKECYAVFCGNLVMHKRKHGYGVMIAYYIAYAYCPSLIGGTREGQQIGTEEASELIQEYKSDDRYEYMPESLKEALFEMTGTVW